MGQIRPPGPLHYTAPPHMLGPHYPINVCNLLLLPIYIYFLKTGHAAMLNLVKFQEGYTNRMQDE